MKRRREVIPIAENKKSGDLQKDNVKGQSHITKIVIISLFVLLLAAIVVIVLLINKNNEKPLSEAQGSIQKTESVQKLLLQKGLMRPAFS